MRVWILRLALMRRNALENTYRPMTDGDLAPEGLKGFQMNGKHYLAIANETSNTTTVYALAPVPEPETYAMLLAGLGLLGVATRRKTTFQISPDWKNLWL